MSLERELAFAKSLARDAGEIMLYHFGQETIDTEWKPDNTPFTVADTAINDLVIDRVTQQFSHDGVIGEEGSYKQESDRVWVLDPIDGTAPFSMQIPLSSFSLALVDRSDGQPVVAVAYDPHQDHLHWAQKGQGSFLNGTPITTSTSHDLKKSYVSVLGGASRKETGHAELLAGQCIDNLRNLGVRNFSLQAFVYAGARVARGQLAGALMSYGSPWDAAAVSLIVQEAGGIAADLKGEKRRYDEFGEGILLAANQAIFHTLLDAINNSRR